MAVRIAVILDRKGAAVTTTSPDSTLPQAARTMAEHNVGALVVSRDGQTIEGILSERDIVRQIARRGLEGLAQTVAEAMTTDVTTCGRSATADDLMAIMTTKRVRHIPVVEDGRLVGIVSIGDVVKSRMDELEIQAQALQHYVSGSSY